METLESIKHQITEYGRQHDFQIIVADDGSSDMTHRMEELWLERNKELFKVIDILPSEQNQGISKNFARTFSYIKGDYVKCIAGDDLIANADIIFMTEEMERKKIDIGIGALFLFSKAVIEIDDQIYKNVFVFFDEDNARMKWISRYAFIIGSGQWVLNSKLLDEAAAEQVGRCALFEDRPLWHYMVASHDVEFLYMNIPITLYRHGHMSVTNPNSEYQKIMQKDYRELYDRFMKEEESIFGRYTMKMNQLQYRIGGRKYIYLNPINYYKRWRLHVHSRQIKSNIDHLFAKYYDSNMSFLKTMSDLANEDYTVFANIIGGGKKK